MQNIFKYIQNIKYINNIHEQDRMLTDILVISVNLSFNWSFGSSGGKVYGYAESGGRAYGYAIWERNLEITPLHTCTSLESLDQWKEMPTIRLIGKKMYPIKGNYKRNCLIWTWL